METTHTQVENEPRNRSPRRPDQLQRRNRPRPQRLSADLDQTFGTTSAALTPFSIAEPELPLTHDDIAERPNRTEPPRRSSHPRQPSDRRTRTPRATSSPRPDHARTTRPSTRPARSQSRERRERPSTQNLLRSTTGRIFRGLAVRLCGYVGGILLAIVSLVVAATVFHLGTHWLLEAAAAITLIRFLGHLAHKSSSVLSIHLLQQPFRRVLLEETQFSVAFMAACFAMEWPVSLRIVAIMLLSNAVVQLGLRALARPLARILFTRKHAGGRQRFSLTALIVGSGPKGTRVADAITSSPELDTRVVGFLDYHRTGFWRYHDIPLVGHPDQLERLIIARQVDALFIALDPADVAHSDRLFRTAEKMGVTVYVLPELYSPEIAKSSMVHLNGLPALVYQTAPHGPVSILVKGIVDRIAALIGLTLSAPIWLVTVIAIKLDSPGPIFFKQFRSGLNGRQFELYKFRTMCSDAEAKKRELHARNEMSGPVFKIRKDPRITPTGRFLRKYSIDELPQLINILKGDMSLVGPRPPIPDEVSKYAPWQRRKLSVKPGLTCLWQVNGRNAIDFEDWMKLDLEYIDNWSFVLDAKIIARTVPTVLRGSGV